MRNCYKKQLIVATVLYLIAIDVLVLGTLLTMYKKWVVVLDTKPGCIHVISAHLHVQLIKQRGFLPPCRFAHCMSAYI